MLTALETIALSKAVKETAVKDARPRLAEGHHNVDFTVRVSGPLLVAPIAKTKARECVPAATLLAFVLETLTPRARAAVVKYIDQELAPWRVGCEDALEVQPTAAECAEELMALAIREKEGTKNGNVTAPLTVEVIGRARVA